MEALSGAKTHAQIASDYGISPDLVKDWKKQAKEMLGECFRRGGRKTEMEKKDELIANLERLLGNREFELDWLSKKSQGVETVAQRRQLLDTNGDAPPRKRQCELLGLARSSTYYMRQAPTDDPATEKAILEPL